MFYVNNLLQSYIDMNNVTFKQLKFLLSIVKDMLSYDEQVISVIIEYINVY